MQWWPARNLSTGKGNELNEMAEAKRATVVAPPIVLTLTDMEAGALYDMIENERWPTDTTLRRSLDDVYHALTNVDVSLD